jgi:hypothetical protein
MHSWQERARRRGAIAFLTFEAEMIKLGFIECDAPRDGALHEYIHPATGDRRYTMPAGDSYSRALERLRTELEEARYAATDTARQ